MDTIRSATTTSNHYNLLEATIVNIHNTLPKTKVERNAEYYRRTRSQGKNIQTDIQKARTEERNRQYISCVNVFGRRLKMMEFFNFSKLSVFMF
jgi:hypothetical protein